MKAINRVAIAGGVHGNELTGAYLVKKFLQTPALVRRSNFDTVSLLGNPKAVEARQRYIDTDLNRCFLQEILNSSTSDSYEASRAKSIRQMLGGKGVVGDRPVDFILDLHSTTANMGLTLILVNEHPFNLKLAAYLSTLSPKVRIYRWLKPGQENAFLNSLCELGLAIEVGAIAQGTLDARIFQETEALVSATLDYLEAVNRGNPPEFSSEIVLYQYLDIVDYPKDENGEIQGMIHPQLQGRDYEPLSPGDPMFLTFDGETITYQGTAIAYPIFINEAAYYEKGIAICLTEKISQKIT